jgi:hypothetical protein
MILSKALLLANDMKITNRTIRHRSGADLSTARPKYCSGAQSISAPGETDSVAGQIA